LLTIIRILPIGDVGEDGGPGSGLIKSLGLWQLTAIGVGGIIGVGIFTLAGVVARGDAANPVLRKTRPDASCTFRIPFMPVVPLFGLLACGFLMLRLHWDTWVRFFGWLAIGMVI
jgi:hypothetical protein